nr:MAG TPA: hypothetical protein [Caudoviricetes sp.]
MAKFNKNRPKCCKNAVYYRRITDIVYSTSTIPK